MPTMVLRFPGGRYHATPGGHHVNEGIVEWPPSPWRIMRALIACGYTTQHWDEVPPEGRRLVNALSRVLPEYRLPRAALGHTRHYMPLVRETTLVIDSFADVGDGTLWVRWPTELDDEAQELFDRLVSHLGYLGRSESWVLGESVHDDTPLPQTRRAIPQASLALAGRSLEQIVLSAPQDPGDYVTWRRDAVEASIAEFELSQERKVTQAQRKKRVDKIEGSYPMDLVECLQWDTSTWKAHKWSRAPGSRSVLYWRDGNALEVGPPSSPHVSSIQRVEVMLIALTTPSGSKSSLPPIARTLPQADLLHQAVVSKLGHSGEPCPELVGRDERGEPLKGHQHAHILPVDFDSDGRLDHIIVFAGMGLGGRAQRAIREVRKTYMKGGVSELQVAVAGIGEMNDLRSIGGGFSHCVDALLGPTDGASTWISTTPFVPPRHLKKSGRSSLVGQVEAELTSRGYPAATIDVCDWTGETLALRHFVRRRERGPKPPIDAGFAIRLEFASPVAGPICLGYGSHFGLGRFSAELQRAPE